MTDSIGSLHDSMVKRPSAPSRTPNVKQPFLYYARLHRVSSHLQENLGDAFSLAEAAALACMSKKAFSRFFHQKTGFRFRDWVTTVRIRHALELMRQRNLSITEVADRVGYRDLGTFERAFKRRTSLTPRAFKKIARPEGCT